MKKVLAILLAISVLALIGVLQICMDYYII